MGRITALTPQRGRRERLNVFLDGRFAFGVAAETALRAGLTAGMDLSEADVERLRDQDEATRLHGDALRYLSFRPRSATEMERYLRGRGADESLVEATMGRLRHAGLVDDEAFARYWVENRAAFSPRGSRALQAELRAKGVGQGDIDDVLEESGDGEDERAYQAGRKRLRLFSHCDEDEFRRRMFSFLQRRGFDYDTVRAATQRLWAARDELL